ncbi:MAG: imidazole glycerol phosphate synthase subunit HisH [Flavobacteriales bacterium]|nr:MAG: imidazole glycerol phosphate synthase subunit HisH [Flavobacteriales bacterium]
MSKKVAIIDYGLGNHFSVQKKVARLGYDVITTHNPQRIKEADKLILPGVGHFGKAMETLQELNLINILNEEVIQKKKPILGICLGMQLMASHSEEGNIEGLNWFDATVERFQVTDKLKYKVPHTGWNQIDISKKNELLENIENHSEFYFVHAYHFNCKDKSDALCKTSYELDFTSAIERNNIFGVQFHPEKSHDVGLQLLKNFIEL